MTRTPELGSVLKAVREQRKLLHKDVMAATGVTAQTVIRWEGGENAPTGPHAAAIEKLLGLPLGYVAQMALAEKQLAEVRALAERQPQLEELLLVLRESALPGQANSG